MKKLIYGLLFLTSNSLFGVTPPQVVDLSTGKVGSTLATIGSNDSRYKIRTKLGSYVSSATITGAVKVTTNNLMVSNDGGTNWSVQDHWIANQTTCQWLSPRTVYTGVATAPSKALTTSAPNRIDYTTYRTTFTLNQNVCNVKDVMINLTKIAFDNDLIIRINGTILLDNNYETNTDPHDINMYNLNLTPIPSADNCKHISTGSKVIPSSYLISGTNTIDFIVNNSSQSTNTGSANNLSWTGFMLDGNLTINYDNVLIPSGTVVNTCYGSPLLLNGSVITDGTSIKSYVWTIYDNLNNIVFTSPSILNSTTPLGTYTLPTSLPVGNYTAVLTVYNCINSFNSTNQISFSILSTPKISAFSSIICYGAGSAEINFTSSTWPVYVFQNGIPFSIGLANSSPFILPSVPTTSTSYVLTNSSSGICASASVPVQVTVFNNDPDFNFNYNVGTTGTVTGTPYFSNNLNSWTLYQLPEFGGAPVQYGATISSTLLNPVNFTNLPLTYSSGAVITYQLCHTASGSVKKPCPQTICKQSGRSHLSIQSEMESKSSIKNALNEISISPNPTNGKFNINLNDVSAEKVVVYNLLGKVVSETTVTENARSLDIDLSELPASVYMVHVHTGGEVIMKKVIKN